MCRTNRLHMSWVSAPIICSFFISYTVQVLDRWFSFAQVILKFRIRNSSKFFCYPYRRILTKMSNLRTDLVEGIAEQSQRPQSSLYFLWQLTGEETASTSCPEWMHWKVSYTAGCKNNSLKTNLKRGTLDMCKNAFMEVRALSRPGDFHFGWRAILPHSWLSCAAVVADILAGANTAKVEPDHNLANVSGYTQSPRLIRVVQEVTPEGDSVTDRQAVLQFEPKQETWLFLEKRKRVVEKGKPREHYPITARHSRPNIAH